MLASRIQGRRLPALVAVLAAGALGACSSAHLSSTASGGAGGSDGGGTAGSAGAAGSAGVGGSGVKDGGVDGPCTDADGDGFTTCQGDCDDNDPNTYPGAPEICGDGKNNGCTGGPADQGCNGLGTFVSTRAGSSNGTGTMTDPVDTIAHGIQNAQAILQANPSWTGLDVYVGDGSYPEKVILVEGITLYGGYSCSKASCTWKHDPKTFTSTIVDQDEEGVLASHNITHKTQLDGFRIEGESLTSTTSSLGASAITIAGGAPTISGNTVDGPVISGTGNSIGIALGGIGNTPIQAPGPVLMGNTIRGGQAPSGASVGVLLGPPRGYTGNQPPGTIAEIRKNVIYGGDAKSSYGIMAGTSTDGTLVFANAIGAGQGSSGSWGIAFSSTLNIDSNRINLDPTQPATCSSGAWCGGIESVSGQGIITNNIVYGAGGDQSTAVLLAQSDKSVQQVLVNSNYLVGAPPVLANKVPDKAAVIVLQNTCGACGPATVGRIRNNFITPGRATTRYGILETQSAADIHPDTVENNDFYFIPYATASDVFYEASSGGIQTDALTLGELNSPINIAGNFAGDCYDTTYHQKSGSPCIDHGVAPDAPDHDFEGDKRPLPKGGKYDVGPDEAP